MSVFLGTHQNRLDVKGRVSIPAPFRTVLRARAIPDEPLLVLIPSLKQPCIEAWPMATFLALSTPLDRLDTFSDEQDDLATALYSDALSIDADKEGRIMLPQDLTHHANLSDSVTFMGRGNIFKIWEPSAAATYRDGARARARGVTLPPGIPGATS